MEIDNDRESGDRTILDRISEILSLADSDIKSGQQYALFYVSAAAAFAGIALFLSPLDFGFYLLSILLVVSGVAAWRLRRGMSWAAYFGILLIAVAASSALATWFLPFLPGPSTGDWTVLIAVIGTWLLLPFMWENAKAISELNTIRLSLETLYFRTLTAQLPEEVRPADQLSKIWYNYWWKRVHASVRPTLGFMFKQRKGLVDLQKKVGYEAYEKLLASWLIEGYPEDIFAYARKKGVDLGEEQQPPSAR